MSASQPGLAERQTILNKLLDAVKQCQIRFGGRTELATEGDSRVACLCAQFENALQHGLRKSYTGLAAIRHVTEIVTGINLASPEGKPVFWHVVRDHLTKHEYERYMLLKNVTTDAGRGRAWLRSALNEHSLERYIHTFLADASTLSQYYEDHAFLLDQERSSMLPMMAAGLGSILFAINIDNPELNSPSFGNSNGSNYLSMEDEPTPVIATFPTDNKEIEKRKNKKALVQIVSFDEDDLNGSSKCVQLSPSFFSAPPTCFSSPTDPSFSPSSLTDGMPSPKIGDAVDCGGNPSTVPTLSDSSSPKPGPTGGGQEGSKSNSENCLVSHSDMECSGSYDECQPSEGSGTCETPTSEAVLNKNSQDEKRVHQQKEAERRNDYVSQHRLEENELLEKLQNSTLTDGKKLPDVLLHSETTTLTPVNDTSVGELIPITGFEEVHSEDSVSLPSYSEDTECAAAALALQKVLQNSSNSGIQLHFEHGSNSAQNLNLSGRDRSESLSSVDLRQAIISMMQKKEEVDEQNKSLRNLLDREMEMCAALRVELEDLKKKHLEKNDKNQSKIQALSRENELLKHQLKKYVGAVQMLKRDEGHPNEALARLTGNSVSAIPEPKPYIDYHFEATEYERKLIQVAEMHGELMEFNERLHRLLSQKEAVVRRLREELIDLRGPLPDDNQTSDDDISVTSDYDTCSMTAASRALINIWIPSAFLTGKSSDSHHVYQVYIRIRDDEWNVYRRYAQFYALHKTLKKKNPAVNTFSFPPKKAIGNKDAKFVEERRKRLQYYLRCIVNLLVQNHSELANNPDKESLVSLMPFFGESSNSDDTRNRRRGSRNPFARSNAPVSAETTSQHYTGL